MHYTWFNVGKVPPAWICIDCTSHGYWGFFCWIVILCCVISFIPQAFPPSSFDRLSYAKSVFAYSKWSKTEQWEGLGTRLLFENIINIQTALNSVITTVFSCTVLLLLKQASTKTVHADTKKQHSGKHGASCSPPRIRVKRAKVYYETTPSDEEFGESDTSTSSEWWTCADGFLLCFLATNTDF